MIKLGTKKIANHRVTSPSPGETRRTMLSAMEGRSGSTDAAATWFGDGGKPVGHALFSVKSNSRNRNNIPAKELGKRILSTLNNQRKPRSPRKSARTPSQARGVCPPREYTQPTRTTGDLSVALATSVLRCGVPNSSKKRLRKRPKSLKSESLFELKRAWPRSVLRQK
jgi:hypothetical protein